MKPPKLPQTDSIAELAQFWDTHDLTDFDSELEEVTETIFQRGSETPLTILLQSEEAEAIKRIANARGMEDGALLREWVLEKLQQA